MANWKGMIKMNILDKIEEILKYIISEKINASECKYCICILSYFDKCKNLALFLCNKEKDKIYCGGHFCVCTLEKAKQLKVFDLCMIYEQFKNYDIRLVIDLGWFIWRIGKEY